MPLIVPGDVDEVHHHPLEAPDLAEQQVQRPARHPGHVGAPLVEHRGGVGRRGQR
ncbi:hypothetical protein ACVGOW_20170 [Pseudonocardia saturnea]